MRKCVEYFKIMHRDDHGGEDSLSAGSRLPEGAKGLLSPLYTSLHMITIFCVFMYGFCFQ